MFARLIAALLLALAGPCLTCCAEELQNPSAAVKVVDARIVTREAGHDVLVTVLGSLKNETGQSVSNLVVEAKLLDAQGKLVDVLTDSLYGIVVMPGDQVAFRLQRIPAAAASPASYAQVQARVTSGESQEAAQPRRETGWGWNRHTFMSLVSNWGPVLLLIAALVWLVWVLWRVSNKKSPLTQRADEQLKLIAAQNALIAEQRVLLQRQVAALEKLARIAPPAPSVGAPPPA
jgi:uncharacterized membrane protein YgcG